MAALFRLVLLGAVIVALYLFFRRSYPIRISMDRGGVTRCKGITKKLQGIIEEFAREQLLEGETLEVKGYFVDGNRIKWIFPRQTNAALAQRFRNLIATEIRY